MIPLLLFLILLALLFGAGFVRGLLQLIFFGVLALIAAVADPDHATLIGVGYCIFAAITVLGGIARRLTRK